jgi:putative ABC transport system permease protein
MVAPRNIGSFGGPTKVLDKEFQATYAHVDEDFVPTLQITIVSGRNFSKEFPSDSINSVLVNQTFIEQAGLREPIGQTVDHMNIPGWGDRKITIIGVIKDYNFESLKEKIKPEILTYEPKLPLGKFLVRVDPNHIPETVKSLETLVLKIVPNELFQYSFVKEINKDYYKKENKWKQIITIAAFLAIFISCIGLFGLTTLTAKKRTK